MNFYTSFNSRIYRTLSWQWYWTALLFYSILFFTCNRPWRWPTTRCKCLHKWQLCPWHSNPPVSSGLCQSPQPASRHLNCLSRCKHSPGWVWWLSWVHPQAGMVTSSLWVVTTLQFGYIMVTQISYLLWAKQFWFSFFYHAQLPTPELTFMS